MSVKGLLIVTFCALGGAAALAADVSSDKQPPPVTDIQGAGTLSDKLSNSNGVIHPAQNGDPGIAKTPPSSGTTPMPVIPPPGTAGGDPGVKPK